MLRLGIAKDAGYQVRDFESLSWGLWSWRISRGGGGATDADGLDEAEELQRDPIDGLGEGGVKNENTKHQNTRWALKPIYTISWASNRMSFSNVK
jgi:hypothetical protein